MLNAANTAVVELLSEENISYGEIAKLSYDEEGTVKSLEIDTKAVNLFKSLISNKIMEIISKETRYTVLIPLGTLSGSEYLMGLGPDIPFYMQLTETAKVDFKHKFTDAGINQVLHQIIVDIDITANIIMLGFSKGFSVSTTAIAAETVIVGAVPDSFTNVIEEPGDDIADEIFNYADID
jgi:sporulation protein YunB